MYSFHDHKSKWYLSISLVFDILIWNDTCSRQIHNLLHVTNFVSHLNARLNKCCLWPPVVKMKRTILYHVCKLYMLLKLCLSFFSYHVLMVISMFSSMHFWCNWCRNCEIYCHLSNGHYLDCGSSYFVLHM